jgi:hypothetical protein
MLARKEKPMLEAFTFASEAELTFQAMLEALSVLPLMFLASCNTAFLMTFAACTKVASASSGLAERLGGYLCGESLFINPAAADGVIGREIGESYSFRLPPGSEAGESTNAMFVKSRDWDLDLCLPLLFLFSA